MYFLVDYLETSVIFPGQSTKAEHLFLTVVQDQVGRLVCGMNTILGWLLHGKQSAGYMDSGTQWKGREMQCHTTLKLKQHWQIEISCDMQPSFPIYHLRKNIYLILQEAFRCHQQWGQGAEAATCKTIREEGIWDCKHTSFHQLMSICVSLCISQAVTAVFIFSSHLTTVLRIKMHLFQHTTSTAWSYSHGGLS